MLRVLLNSSKTQFLAFNILGFKIYTKHLHVSDFKVFFFKTNINYIPEIELKLQACRV